MYLAFGIFGFKHLGSVFLPLTICPHEAADLIGASTHPTQPRPPEKKYIVKYHQLY